ncbi:MAG TPA: SDR family oxidoreductase [Baekduia sp.]|nr:SDR family oxidoreductase [Baekduia sp.]
MLASATTEGCALVTGGNRGIGLAVAERLRADGWTVATLARSSGDAQADVADFDAVESAIGEIREKFGPVLVLVNNAGITADGLAIRMDANDFKSVVDVNLGGTFNCTRHVLSDMMRARWGRIVNVSSVIAEHGNPGQANYSASKAGILGFTRTIAKEMGRKGITCNAVTPGLIETDMTTDIGDNLLVNVPAARAGTPAEVASAVAFLCSDDAAYINGATLAIDGGLGA